MRQETILVKLDLTELKTQTRNGSGKFKTQNSKPGSLERT
ncbi:hypothetical protein MC7420_7548 [Coleofasciculus chthonoplastes PCC 7420]|uniref:Uncharacterized protein n=1 Tax=Coleofasciculus chthonoplastes PCC 7420 TaxID=118168 RepID=B4W109_9CYAN|nr:hypothetical protein MC7420_7548 [Coleofasciculus chthonoplastes PCC 7420]